MGLDRNPIASRPHREPVGLGAFDRRKGVSLSRVERSPGKPLRGLGHSRFQNQCARTQSDLVRGLAQELPQDELRLARGLVEVLQLGSVKLPLPFLRIPMRPLSHALGRSIDGGRDIVPRHARLRILAATATNDRILRFDLLMTCSLGK